MIGSQVQVKILITKLYINFQDFKYLLLVKRCRPLLTVGAIGVSNPRVQLVTDAMHFAWIGLLQAGYRG